jgi:release factor glutamine methyltransferase
VPIDAVIGSLNTPFMPRLRQLVDVLIFNPPYVPTSYEEVLHAQCSRGVSGAWAGGADGMEVTNQLLADLDVSFGHSPCYVLLIETQNVLSPVGRFYLVALKQNNIPDIFRKLIDQGFAVEAGQLP